MNRYSCRRYRAKLNMWHMSNCNSPSLLFRYSVYYYDKPSLQQIRADVKACIPVGYRHSLDLVVVDGEWRDVDGSLRHDPPC